ncbi:MobA/MobL family protein [Microvirga sp. ACRRW]|uniref:MobA/MobL family protein n=1 Tax=Microvirga sp. ACRRW TaxID=2918205 RepID=UPI001EF4ED6A|nr:MobA/MobL family protein [Microvirga sp. ACRRW]MCG7392648.1 MobA/MobL family protein [Microvirga sp. ACRRW]
MNPEVPIWNALQDLSRAVARAKVRAPSNDFSGLIPAPAFAGSEIASSPGIDPVVRRAFDNPGIRFGKRTKGSSRPVSPTGTVSCHFSQTFVSKTSPILKMIEEARTGRRRVSSSAAAHELYIERENAAEKIEREREAYYDSDDGYVGTERSAIERLQQEAAERSSEGHQSYLERFGAVEIIPDGISDADLDALEIASFGTIGKTLAERHAFWRKVEEAESTPQGDDVDLRRSENEAWWQRALAASASAPPALRKVLQEQARSGVASDIRLKIPTAKALDVYRWAIGIGRDAPIKITPGRGGRTQTRIIAELPYELYGRERLEIVRDFTRKLSEKGFPFWAVIHAPDASNDARNYHVHIVYYDRPCRRMPHPKTGELVWDFEIQEEKVYKSYNRRVVRPFQQNKSREASRKTWISTLRAAWERTSNAALEKAQVGKRYHLSSNASVGIELDPLKHIPSRTFNKERKGELTAEGSNLARRQWQLVLQQLIREHEKRRDRRRKAIDHRARLASQKAHSFSLWKAVAIGEIEKYRCMAHKTAARLSFLEFNQDLVRFVTDRVVSRPKLMAHSARKEDGLSGRKRSMADAGEGDPLPHLSALRFMNTVYDAALTRDRENGLLVARTAALLRSIVARLDIMIRQPRIDPRHLVRDRIRHEAMEEAAVVQRAERKGSVADAVQRYADAAIPAILQKLDAIGDRGESQASGLDPVGGRSSARTADRDAAGQSAGSGIQDGHTKPISTSTESTSPQAVAARRLLQTVPPSRKVETERYARTPDGNRRDLFVSPPRETGESKPETNSQAVSPRPVPTNRTGTAHTVMPKSTVLPPREPKSVRQNAPTAAKAAPAPDDRASPASSAAAVARQPEEAAPLRRGLARVMAVGREAAVPVNASTDTLRAASRSREHSEAIQRQAGSEAIASPPRQDGSVSTPSTQTAVGRIDEAPQAETPQARKAKMKRSRTRSSDDLER